MTHLADVTTDELREALAAVEGKRPTQRLMVAIAYRNGVPQSDLARWYGLSRKTVYNWLTKLDEGPLPDAAYDEDRPGRPRKLDEAARERLRETVADSPSAVGYDADEWTPRLLRDHVESRFGVSYTRRSTRRLLSELGE